MSAEIIYSYSRKQALEDGVLIDLNQFIPIRESGFKFPVACTAAVFEIIDLAVNNPKYCNDYQGVVWDILNMSRMHPVRVWDTGRAFQVIIAGAGKKRTYEFKLECGPGDDGEPVLTIMMIEED